MISEVKTLKKTVTREALNILSLVCGCFLYGFAVSLIMKPNNMAPGGVSGIAVLVNSVLPSISTGTLIFLMNVPLMLTAYLKLGRKFVLYTILAIVSISVSTDLAANLGAAGLVICPVTNEKVLACIYGGLIMGVGTGMVLRTGGSSGGTDILAKVIRLKHKEFKFGKIQLSFNLLIVFASAFVFGNIDAALYTGIAIFISGNICDMVIYGTDSAKLLFIMSDKNDEISKKLLADLGAGVTFLDGYGAYSGKKENVVISVLRKHDFTKAREIVKEVDPNAFLIISSAQEVFGKGYKRHDSED